MNIKNTVFSTCIAFLESAITYLFGGWTFTLKILVFMIIADYITGIVAAAYKKELSSEVGFKGIWKKIFILVICALAYQIDKGIFNGGEMLFNVAAYFYVANEGLSIMENAIVLGVPIPEFLRSLLSQVKESSNKGEMMKKVD